jgi:hypothetical protein
MGVLHPIRRIGALNRGNLTEMRQIESGANCSLVRATAVRQGHRMKQNDPILGKIVAQFTNFEVEPSRGGYTIVDRRTAGPIARLRPIADTDRFELFYWSNVKGRWTTFGNMGRMMLMLKSAHEIVENDPMFRLSRRP